MQDILHSPFSKGLRIGLRISGLLTVFGGGYILQDIAKDAARWKSTKNRIIFFMSICDVINQVLNSLIGEAAVPKDIGLLGAVGNETTCDIQGFLAYWSGGASGLYNVSLAICYLLIVQYDFSDDRLKRLEPYFLYPPMLIFLVLSASGFPFQIYNYDLNNNCFIEPSPMGCDLPGSPVECERGAKYQYWNYVNALLVVIAGGVIIFCMLKMYKAVLQRERSGDRFRFTTSSGANSSTNSRASSNRRSGANPNRQLSRMMGRQGLWYSGAFLFTFVPLLVYSITNNHIVDWVMLYSFHLIGFTNFVIYIRPRFVNFRMTNPTVGIASSIWHTLARSRPATGSPSQQRGISIPASLISLVSRVKDCLRLFTNRSERNNETKCDAPHDQNNESESGTHTNHFSKEVSSSIISKAEEETKKSEDEEEFSPILESKKHDTEQFREKEVSFSSSIICRDEQETKNNGTESSTILDSKENDQRIFVPDRNEDCDLDALLDEENSSRESSSIQINDDDGMEKEL